MGDFRLLAVLVGFAALAAALPAAADAFKLGNNQRIACGRGLSAGKIATSTCTSYAYLFNTRTSEYFRCFVKLELTRNNQEVLTVRTDGNCERKARIFAEDSRYVFEATETEPTNTNAFFGPGGYAVWASDATRPKVRGCIILDTGLGSEVSRCVDMSVE